MCMSSPTIAPRSFIHYHKHHTNSAADSVFQQLTKYIHSYFAVLFAECHCTRPALYGRGTASTIQLLRTELREGCSWKNRSEASQPACWSASAACPRTWHATLFRAARRGATWRGHRPATNLQNSGHYMYHHVNIHKFYVLPTQCIYLFCVDLRTNNDYFPIQH